MTDDDLARHIDGSACVYNREKPYMPDLLICRREFAAPILNALSGRTG